MPETNNLIQLAIIVCSCSAIWLIGHERAGRRRCGYLIGLAGQPFWIYASFAAGNWGILLVSIWFTVAYGYGLKNHWRG